MPPLFVKMEGKGDTKLKEELINEGFLSSHVNYSFSRGWFNIDTLYIVEKIEKDDTVVVKCVTHTHTHKTKNKPEREKMQLRV